MYDNIGDEKQLSFSSEILLNALKLPPTTQQLWITYSGGVDSHVLLHAIAQLHSQLSPIQLRAVHIHHGLNEQADDWATHCFKVCQQLNVPCDVLKVKIIKQTRQSLEALARQARYNAIKKIINDGDVALTAQHADDQAETLLLQLLRGAGAAGLSAMPQLASLGRGWLMRPLLNFTQADLLNYAEYHQLKWIEDSSNQNIHFDRNFLRHQVIPVLKNRWESMTPVLNRVAQHQAETTILLMELAQQDYVSCRGIQASQLHLPTLQLLSIARQRNLIRFWIKQSNLPTPTTVQLEHILVNVIAAQNDRQPVVKWQGGEVRRYQDHLYVMANLPKLPQKNDFAWLVTETLDLPLGQLMLISLKGKETTIPENMILQVKLRQGGETCRVNGHQQAVKKLLQAAQLPPWLRPFQPLIYHQNNLVFIPNIAVCENFQWLTQDFKIIWQYSIEPITKVS